MKYCHCLRSLAALVASLSLSACHTDGSVSEPDDLLFYYDALPLGTYTGAALMRRLDDLETDCPATLEVEKLGRGRIRISGGAQCGNFAFALLETEAVIDDSLTPMPVRILFERQGVRFKECELEDRCTANFWVIVRPGAAARGEFSYQGTVVSLDAQVDFRVSLGGDPAPSDGHP